MTIEEILVQDDFDKVKAELCQDRLDYDNKPIPVEEYIKEYRGDHKILDKPDKKVKRDITNDAGVEEKGTAAIIKLAKLVLELQRLITQKATAFLVGNPPKSLDVTPDPTDASKNAYELLNQVKAQNRIDYFNKSVVTTVFSETAAMELWFAQKLDGNSYKIRKKLLSKGLGYDIYPHYDEYGDLDALTVKYSDSKKTNYIDIYTADKTVKASNKTSDAVWAAEFEDNPYGKITAVYYSIQEAVWSPVQSLIERLENIISGHADANDYYGHPAIIIKGNLINPPDKESIAKTFQMESEETSDGKLQYGDISYLERDKNPESIKLEIDNLLAFIYSVTSTPNLAFNNLKDIGTALSGISIRLMFMDAEIAASEAEIVFGTGFSRRDSVLKTMLAYVEPKSATGMEELKTKDDFQSIVPSDVMEMIETLAVATNGKQFLSQESAVAKSPLTDNAEEEYEKVQADEESLAGSLNIDED